MILTQATNNSELNFEVYYFWCKWTWQLSTKINEDRKACNENVYMFEDVDIIIVCLDYKFMLFFLASTARTSMAFAMIFHVDFDFFVALSSAILNMIKTCIFT